MVRRRTEFKEMYLVDTFLLNKLSSENNINNINHNSNTVSIDNKEQEKEWSQSPIINKQTFESPPNNSIGNEKRENDVEKYVCKGCKDEEAPIYEVEETYEKGEDKLPFKDLAINSSLWKSAELPPNVTSSQPTISSQRKGEDFPQNSSHPSKNSSLQFKKVHSYNTPLHTKSSTLNNVQAQLNHDLIPKKNSYTPLPLHMDVDEDPKMLQYNQQKQIPYNPQPTPTIKLEANLRGNDPMDTSSLPPHPAVPPPIHPVSREVLNLNEKWLPVNIKKKKILQEKKEKKMERLKQPSKDIVKKNNDLIKVNDRNQVKDTPSKHPPLLSQDTMITKKGGSRYNEKKMIEHKYKPFYCVLCNPNTFFDRRQALERHMKNIHDAFMQEEKGTKRPIQEKDKVNKRLKETHSKYPPHRYIKYT